MKIVFTFVPNDDKINLLFYAFVHLTFRKKETV